jgi:hypothetical protein
VKSSRVISVVIVVLLPTADDDDDDDVAAEKDENKEEVHAKNPLSVSGTLLLGEKTGRNPPPPRATIFRAAFDDASIVFIRTTFCLC